MFRKRVLAARSKFTASRARRCRSIDFSAATLFTSRRPRRGIRLVSPAVTTTTTSCGLTSTTSQNTKPPVVNLIIRDCPKISIDAGISVIKLTVASFCVYSIYMTAFSRLASKSALALKNAYHTRKIRSCCASTALSLASASYASMLKNNCSIIIDEAKRSRLLPNEKLNSGRKPASRCPSISTGRDCQAFVISRRSLPMDKDTSKIHDTANIRAVGAPPSIRLGILLKPTLASSNSSIINCSTWARSATLKFVEAAPLDLAEFVGNKSRDAVLALKIQGTIHLTPPGERLPTEGAPQDR